MKALITIFLLLNISLTQAASLNICINRELDPQKLANIDKDLTTKEVLFKNIYETLFYYSKSTNKIKSNIAKKIETVSKGNYRVILDKKVPFHTNKTFFVKKNVDYKDIHFSLKENTNLKNLKITKKGLEFTSPLKIKDLYIELSSPRTIIKSKAYWNYLTKIKKQNLFYIKPIGTGPFHIEKINDAPYLLNKFESYHLSNRISSLKYTVSKSYIKDKCDIFWDYESSQKKVYTIKHSFESYQSEFDSLIFAVNMKNNKWITKVVDPLELNSIILKNIEEKVTSLPIPLNIKKTYLINRKIISKEKKSKTIKFSFSKEVLRVISLRNISSQLNRYFQELNINFLLDDKVPDILIDVKYDLDKLTDLNKEILCPYESVACNKIDSLKKLEEILLKEKRIVPIGFIKRTIFYKKNIKNIKFDFGDTIDYSEIRL